MANKKTYSLTIKTTFIQHVDYECDANTIEDAIEQAYNDSDLLANALDTFDFDTEIKAYKKPKKARGCLF